VQLAPRQTKQVHFTLDARDLAYWNTDANGWVSPAGKYTVLVGDSSRHLPLSAPLVLPRTAQPR
jgi:beta-glucosidase